MGGETTYIATLGSRSRARRCVLARPRRRTRRTPAIRRFTSSDWTGHRRALYRVRTLRAMIPICYLRVRMAEKRENLYLVDGSGNIFRAFFPLPQLNNSRGMPTNAISGFPRMLVNLLKDARPSHIAIVF